MKCGTIKQLYVLREHEWNLFLFLQDKYHTVEVGSSVLS